MRKIFWSAIFAVSVSCSAPDEIAVPEPAAAQAYVTVPDRSEEVTEAAVRSVAALFGGGDATRAGEREIETIHTLRSATGEALCYAVNYRDGQGFVVVSATKDYMPVLAFGDEGRFDVENIERTGVSVWLAEQQAVIERAAELPDSVRLRCRAMWEAYNAGREPLFNGSQTRGYDDVINLMSRSVSQWEAEGYTVYRLSDFKDTYEFQELPAEVREKLLNLPYGYANPRYGGVYAASFVLKKSTTTNIMINSLLKTTWSQRNGYNQSIPHEGAVGCTAIAVGQIMKYHRYPLSYDWDAMPNNWATKTTSDFLYDVGRKIGIFYQSGDSSAGIDDSKDALHSFGYTKVSVRDHVSNTVVNELQHNRPVYMKGRKSLTATGHAWVCDGVWTGNTFGELKLMTLEDCPEGYEPDEFLNPYTTEEITGYIPTRFHMNWGWGGLYDGYFVDEDIRIRNDNNEVVRDYREYRKDIVNIYPVK